MRKIVLELIRKLNEEVHSSRQREDERLVTSIELRVRLKTFQTVVSAGDEVFLRFGYFTSRGSYKVSQFSLIDVTALAESPQRCLSMCLLETL